MIKRTVEISTGPTYLSIKDDQLVLTREREVVATIPCEDIGVVIVDHPAFTYTHALLTTLARFGAVLIVCGQDHHPAALVYPIEGNALHTERLRLQVESTRPCGKRIWRQLVQAKIHAQAKIISPNDPAHRKLLALARSVRSGDPSNVEAHAAKVYWKALFAEDAILGSASDRSASPLTKGGPLGGRFHRDPEGPPPNNLLNYGYMALRAAVARAICTAGLHPSIGFHHRNRYNAFCLADDLVEPLRPLVDARVRDLVARGKTEVDREAKESLLGVLTETVVTAAESGPLMVGLSRMMASLVRVLEGGERKLEIPVSCN